tara:strand:+ start:104 stop:295 length:192 start_codon:yes stop_codon:yes gene_type:complete
MINFICKYAGIFFCLAAYICTLPVMIITAIVVPSVGATLMMVAVIIFMTGQFIDLLIAELKEL